MSKLNKSDKLTAESTYKDERTTQNLTDNNEAHNDSMKNEITDTNKTGDTTINIDYTKDFTFDSGNPEHIKASKETTGVLAYDNMNSKINIDSSDDFTFDTSNPKHVKVSEETTSVLGYENRSSKTTTLSNTYSKTTTPVNTKQHYDRSCTTKPVGIDKRIINNLRDRNTKKNDDNLSLPITIVFPTKIITVDGLSSMVNGLYLSEIKDIIDKNRSYIPDLTAINWIVDILKESKNNVCREIKPQNIILTRDGEIFICDTNQGSIDEEDKNIDINIDSIGNMFIDLLKSEDNIDLLYNDTSLIKIIKKMVTDKPDKKYKSVDEIIKKLEQLKRKKELSFIEYQYKECFQVLLNIINITGDTLRNIKSIFRKKEKK